MSTKLEVYTKYLSTNVKELSQLKKENNILPCLALFALCVNNQRADQKSFTIF